MTDVKTQKSEQIDKPETLLQYNNDIISNITDEKTQISEQIDKPKTLLQYLNTT